MKVLSNIHKNWAIWKERERDDDDDDDDDSDDDNDTLLHEE